MIELPSKRDWELSFLVNNILYSTVTIGFLLYLLKYKMTLLFDSFNQGDKIVARKRMFSIAFTFALVAMVFSLIGSIYVFYIELTEPEVIDQQMPSPSPVVKKLPMHSRSRKHAHSHKLNPLT